MIGQRCRWNGRLVCIWDNKSEKTKYYNASIGGVSTILLHINGIDTVSKVESYLDHILLQSIMESNWENFLIPTCEARTHTKVTTIELLKLYTEIMGQGTWTRNTIILHKGRKVTQRVNVPFYLVPLTSL